MTLTSRVSNTVGMTMPLSLYSKGTDALGITLGTVYWALPNIQYSQSPSTAMFWMYQHSRVPTLVYSKLQCVTSLGVTITHGTMT